MNTFNHLSILILLLLLSCSGVSAQNDTIISEPETDSSVLVKSVPKHALYSGTGYGSITFYPGTSLPENQTFGYTSLMYSFKNQLFGSVAAFTILESGHPVDFFSYSLNYMHNVTDWLDMSMMVAFFQFNKSSADTMLHNFAYSDFTAGFNWKIFHAYLSCSGLFSSQNQYYSRLKNSAYFQTPSIFKGRAFISFNPYITLLSGSYFKTEISSPILNSSATKNSASTYSGSEVTSLTKAFGLLEVTPGLPVAINFKKLILELETGYIIPLNTSVYLPQAKGFNFNVSLFFRIF